MRVPAGGLDADAGKMRAGRGRFAGQTRADAVPSYFLAVLYVHIVSDSTILCCSVRLTALPTQVKLVQVMP